MLLQTTDNVPDSHFTDELIAKQVHVWNIALGVNVGEAALHALVPWSEIIHSQRFRECVRQKYLTIRAGLRSILSLYVHVPPVLIDFGIGTHGKPYLKNRSPTELHFNLSHSGSMAVVAVAEGARVGIDIEKVDPDLEVDELAPFVFSPREYQTFVLLPRQFKTLGFVKGWVSKEAYLKGIGRGLSVPLDRFEVCVDPKKDDRLIRPLDGQTNWHFCSTTNFPTYRTAVVVEHFPRPVIVFDWQIPVAGRFS